MNASALLIFIGCAASALAQVPLPYERLGRDNVTVRLEGSTGRIGTAVNKGYNKAVDVSISPIGNAAPPVVLEFYVIVKSENFVPFARLVERQQAEVGGAKKYHFELGKFGGMDVKGWIVRALRDNRVVGFVAPVHEYEKFATDPALLAQWVAQRSGVRTEREERYQEKFRERLRRYGAN